MTSHIRAEGEKFRVLIVGAGIAGLGAATALSQKGQSVTILERSASLNEFGASIGIQANGVRCLKAWGLTDYFQPFVSRLDYWEFHEGVSGDLIGRIPHNAKNHSLIEYGDENWNMHRKDYQDVLARAATESGTKIVFGVQILDIDIDKCRISTTDGQIFTADLIVGADGMASQVRKWIPSTSHVEPITSNGEQCWRCTVPKELMRQSPRLRFLLENDTELMWLMPGRYVFGWPLVENRDYDIVICVRRKGDIPVGKWGTVVDPEEPRKDFEDFNPMVKELLSHMKTAVKWTLGEVPPLTTCRSENGLVLLMGDAFHAMLPHCASGGASAIEDAACLAECMEWAWQKHVQGANLDLALKRATNAYEELRKERVERMQRAGHEGYQMFGIEDPAHIQMRNEGLQESTRMYDLHLALPEDERRGMPKPMPDMNEPFHTEPYRQWAHGHDAIAEAKKYLANQTF